MRSHTWIQHSCHDSYNRDGPMSNTISLKLPPRYRSRTVNRPRISGEPCILLPTFINNCHWIALARREIDQQVYFLYCDDMNNKNTENDLKNFIQHRTCLEFYPTSTIWINIKSICYFPHSNECGPRSLLALHMMALHPNPNNDMLTPIMHSNLVQITRTWIAASLISGKLIDRPLIQYSNNFDPKTGFVSSVSNHFIMLISTTTPNPQNIPPLHRNLSNRTSQPIPPRPHKEN
jgi:hypothetical protein